MVLTKFVPFWLRYREDEGVDHLLINLVELKRRGVSEKFVGKMRWEEGEGERRTDW